LDVTVVSPGGTSFTTSSDQFTSYVQPTITGVNPKSGPVGGGYYVTVTGTNFTGTTSVNVGDVVTAFQVLDNNTLSVYIPGSDSGPGDSTSISVTSPGGTSPNTHADQFTYDAPATLAVTPTAGRPGKTVKASGANFLGGETVTVVYSTGLSAPAPSEVTVCTATTSSTGTFACKGKIPTKATAGAKGVHFITASGAGGGSDSASLSFTLT
jgi:hypothetical protein